jgi:hypothetical protein
MAIDTARYDPVWRAAEPYMRARKNDVHLTLAFDWAVKMLAHYPEADADVVLLATMLHDIGWYSIDMKDIIEKGFRDPDNMQTDVRFLHEKEGVRLATEVLRKTGWSEDVIKQVCDIIDGHDTRKEPRHLNDRIMRDCDKIWRYNVTGVAIGSDWFGNTPCNNLAAMVQRMDWFETEVGRAMAEAELAITQKALKCNVL